jgi:hypothetical protein
MFRNPGRRGSSGSMEKLITPPAQPGFQDPPPTVDLTADADAHEIAERGQHVLRLSRELNSSSKALLEQIDPVA